MIGKTTGGLRVPVLVNSDGKLAVDAKATIATDLSVIEGQLGTIASDLAVGVIAGVPSIKMNDGAGNALTSTTLAGGHTALDVNIVGGSSGGGGGGSASTVTLSGIGSGVTLPVSGSMNRSWNLSASTDSLTAAVSSLPAVSLASGQNVGVSSLPAVSLASGQNVGISSLPSVSVSNFPATQPVSGTVAVSGTIPVSAASALPVSGAVTSNPPAGSLTMSNSSVGTSSATLLAASSASKMLVVQNTHATQSLYVSTTTPATATNGILIPPTWGYEFPYIPTNALYCLGSGASTTYTLLYA